MKKAEREKLLRIWQIMGEFLGELPKEAVSKPKSERSHHKKPTPQVLDLMEYWQKVWLGEKHTEPFAFMKKDYTTFDKVVQLAGGNMAVARMKIYDLISGNDRWLRSHANPTLLMTRWNELKARAPEDYGGGDGEVEVASQ